MSALRHIHHEVGRVLWHKPAIAACLAAVGTVIGHLLAPGSLPV